MVFTSLFLLFLNKRKPRSQIFRFSLEYPNFCHSYLDQEKERKSRRVPSVVGTENCRREVKDESNSVVDTADTTTTEGEYFWEL